MIEAGYSNAQIMSTIINDKLQTGMVRITSAGCLYEFPTLSFITYIFVFTTRFLMLFLFLTTAQMFMFLKTFFMFSDLNKTLISSSNIPLICLNFQD